ncbi:MAG: Rrf2 family transcriptional regulator [Candidatus Zixiibacteriota bacterium]
MINNRTLYAIEALVELASCKDYSSTAEEISNAKSIPGKFLPQILSNLSNHGLVRSTRGYGGGVQLAVAPEDISLLHIIECMQNNLFFYDYLVEQSVVPDGVGELTLQAFGKTQDAMKDELSKVTLKTLAGKTKGKGKRK